MNPRTGALPLASGTGLFYKRRMTPPAPSDPTPAQTTPSRNPYRSELTRELMRAHREKEIETHLPTDEATLAASARAGASWFYWVAALSVINSVITLSGGHVSFLAGLSLSQVADAIAAHLGFVGPYFSLGTSLMLAFFFCGFGYLTTHGSRAAFLTGMVVYALDGLIFLLVPAYLPAGFHAFVLFNMIVGWNARQKLAKLRAEKITAAPAP